MEADKINITKQGLWIANMFSEYQNPVNDIMTNQPVIEAHSSKIFKDEHVESEYFYEI